MLVGLLYTSRLLVNCFALKPSKHMGFAFKSSAASFYEIHLEGYLFPRPFRDGMLLASRLILLADHGHSGARQTFVLKVCF